MKVLVLGANGKTGSLVVNRAIAAGHEVTVLVRHSGTSSKSGVKVIHGDALEPEVMLQAMVQQDAVIDCIGGTAPWKMQTLEREAMENIVAAMKKSKAQRLIVVSAMGVAESAKQSPWWYLYIMVPTFLRGSTADKTKVEAVVRSSGLNWVIARPPILGDGPATGNVRVFEGTAHKITRADLADWLVRQLEDNTYLSKAVVIANS